MNFGNILKQLRLENSLTQDELAKKVNTSRSNIANYENNKNMPSIDILEKLAKVFKCSTDFLIGIDTYKDLYQEYSIIQKDIAILDKLSPFEIDFLEKLINDSFNTIGKPIKGQNDVKNAIHCDKISEEELETLISDIFMHFQIYFYEYPRVNGSHVFSTLALKEFNRLDEIELQKNANYLNRQDVQKNKYYMCPVYGQIPAGEPNWAEELIEGRIPIDPDMMNIANPEECFFLRVKGESMNKIIQNGDYALIRKQDFVESGEIAAILVNGFDATLKKFKQQGDLIILEPMSNDSSFEVQIYGKDTPIKILGKLVGHFGIN